jgi:hypothetical protein
MPKPLLPDPAALLAHDTAEALFTSPSRRTRPRLLLCILTSRHAYTDVHCCLPALPSVLRADQKMIEPVFELLLLPRCQLRDEQT